MTKLPRKKPIQTKKEIQAKPIRTTELKLAILDAIEAQPHLIGLLVQHTCVGQNIYIHDDMTTGTITIKPLDVALCHKWFCLADDCDRHVIVSHAAKIAYVMHKMDTKQKWAGTTNKQE